MVVNREEDFEKCFERDDGGVKLHLDHFGMAGCSAAHRLIGRTRVWATGIGGKGRFNAVNLFVSPFDAPEASTANHESRHGITGGRRYMGRVQGLIAAVATLRA